MKLLLIWPRAQYEADWGDDLGAIAEPLALEYLAAAAQEQGHEVRLLDLRLHREDLDATLTEFQPELVGVTAFSMHVRAALRICDQVKALCPSCRTVVGGHHAKFLPEDFYEAQIDFVVSGEGVHPLREIMRKMELGKLVSGIAGVWSRVNGKFTFGGEPPPIEVDSLPMPDRQIAKADRAGYFIDWMRPIALVRTSVGCPFRCSFCSLWQFMGGKYLMRDIDRVVTEMMTIDESFVFLVDDEAFINGKRMKELAGALKSAGLHKRFFTYCRVDSLIREQEALQAWREIGLERLFVGVDAISKKDLTEYNKRTRIDQIERAFDVARDLDIEIFAQFVVNTDYSVRDFDQLKRFIDHHKIAYPTFTVLTPLPGTELLKNFDAITERQPNGRPNWDLFDTAHAVTATRLPAEEFRRHYRDLFREYKAIYRQHRERNLSPAETIY
jgi:radical SAM superfamily enzyme YgiQ (UPF0313 family)